MDEDITNMMKEVLLKIDNREKTTVLNCVKDLDLLKEKKIQLEASQIYADKELEASEEYESNKDQEVNKVTISNEIYELHSGLNNHRLIHKLAQKMMDNVKIQDAVFTSLTAMDVEETVDNFPDSGEILSQYSQNLEVSQKLIEVIDHKTQLEKDILNHRVKYCKLLKQIKDKWTSIDKKSTGEHEGENERPEIKKLRTKLDERYVKLRILAVMLQSLITCTGIDWGGNSRLIQTLILCDSALSISKQTNLQQDINTLRSLRSQGSDEPRSHQSPTKRSHDDSDRQRKLSDYIVRKSK